MARRVVLICGPPGAGKTTLARSLGLVLYDFDDAQWSSERQFNEALARIGNDPNAQAVVIRSGATRSARSRTADMIAATETIVLDVPAHVCIRRVRARGRGYPSMDRQVAAVEDWYRRYQPVPKFYPAQSRRW